MLYHALKLGAPWVGEALERCFLRLFLLTIIYTIWHWRGETLLTKRSMGIGTVSFIVLSDLFAWGVIVHIPRSRRASIFPALCSIKLRVLIVKGCAVD